MFAISMQRKLFLSLSFFPRRRNSRELCKSQFDLIGKLVHPRRELMETIWEAKRLSFTARQFHAPFDAKLKLN